MDKKLTDAFAAIRKVTIGLAGSTEYVRPGSDEAKALEAFLFVIERHVTNMDDIATIMRNNNKPDTPRAA